MTKLMQSKIFLSLLTILCLFSLANSAFAKVEFATISTVKDGDTIKLTNGKTIRYIGINSPEIKSNECFGAEAKSINSKLVKGKKVKLVSDKSDTDKYGRLLRYVYVGNEFINDYLIKNGYATTLTISPDLKHSKTLKQSQEEARKNKRGLWGKCVAASKGNFYVSSHPSSKYYYCGSDFAWKSLSEKYLMSFKSEKELVDQFPSHKLHKPCKS